MTMRPLRLGLLALLVGAGACQSPELGFAIALRIEFDASVSDAQLGAVRRLRFSAAGDDNGSFELPLDRPPAREERTLYRPGLHSRTVALTAGETSFATLVVYGAGGPDLAADLVGGLGDGATSSDLGGPAETISFVATRGVKIGLTPRGVARADFNGDGRPDVAVVSEGVGTVQVFLTQADGTLPASPSFTSASFDARAVAVGDLSGDGKADLIIARGVGTNLTLLSGNGAGGFPTESELPIGADASDIVTADFDGDGALDIAVTSSSLATIWVRHSSDAFASLTTLTIAAPSNRLHAADLNGDGKADLVVVHPNTSVQRVLSTGTRTYGPAASVSVPSGAHDVAIGDLSGDGRPELVALPGEPATKTATLIANDGAGTLSAGAPLLLGVGVVRHAKLVDLDGDGKLDLVSTHDGDALPELLVSSNRSTALLRNDSR